MKILKTILLTLFVVAAGNAHEGHDHDGPSSFQPKKGGVVKSTEEINIEAVTQKESVDLYFFDQEGTLKSQDSFTVTAEVQLPKQKKKEKATLSPVMKEGQFSHFEIKGHPKKAHRYTLVISVKDLKEKHADKISFTIEPMK